MDNGLQDDLNPEGEVETPENDDENLDYLLEDDGEDVDYKAEAEKQRKIAENQRIRAEKAEKEAKVLKGKEKQDAPQNKEQELTVKDSARLQQANVPVDDWDTVVEFARFKKISIQEALNSDIVKSTLSAKAEERRTAETANAGKARRQSSRVSGDTLLHNAKSKGEIPDSDADLDALLEQRYKS